MKRGRKIRLVAGRACEVRERATGPLGPGHSAAHRDWSVRSPKAFRLDTGRDYTGPALHPRYGH
jgi:hypothetical protein